MDTMEKSAVDLISYLTDVHIQLCPMMINYL